MFCQPLSNGPGEPRGRAKSIPEGVNVKIILEGDHYARFRADLLAHRDKFPLNDADYVDQVLKISLNTFKKCVNAAGHLALTRPTFLHIFVSTGLNPKDYGLAMACLQRAHCMAVTKNGNLASFVDDFSYIDVPF